MKKLFALLLIAALTLALFACAPDNGDEPDPTPDPEPESGIFTPDELLIDTLCEHIRENKGIDAVIGSSYTTLAELVAKIENGKIPFFLDTKDAKPYFVAAYLESPESYGYYPDPSIFTWVGFRNAADITKVYEGLEIVELFQVNPASTARNLLIDGETNTDIAAFWMYRPSFVNGKNVYPPMNNAACGIYFAEGETDIYFCPNETYSYGVYTRLKKINGTPYFASPIRDGDVTEAIRSQLGDYYSAFEGKHIEGTGIIDDDGYSMDGKVLYSIDDLESSIKAAFGEGD